ncbi:MAG: ATP-binding protein [Salinivirgaceae bacterium]|nr:ATP-binding protein [Salinivirgaceae bacterium]
MIRQKPNNKYSLTIKNQLSEIKKIVEVIDVLSADWNISAKMNNHLNLVVEEIVSNIIFYAYSDKNEHEIIIEFAKQKNSITIQITDNGKHFDLIKYHGNVNVNAKVEDRKIGGLGIHILKKLVDEIEYKRMGNLNVIKLVKCI